MTTWPNVTTPRSPKWDTKRVIIVTLFYSAIVILGLGAVRFMLYMLAPIGSF